jgi:hypothetical protein
MVEVALMAPWIFFLFIGILDMGYYAYAAICTENAARVAATRAANDQFADVTQLCLTVRDEMKHLPNATSLNACANNAASVTSALPIAVEKQRLLRSGTSPDCPAECRTDLNPPITLPPSGCGWDSQRITVTYQTIPMVPIPGLLMGQMRITRIVEMREVAN